MNEANPNPKNKEQAPDRKAITIECATCVCYDLDAKECRPNATEWKTRAEHDWCRDWHPTAPRRTLGKYDWAGRLFWSNEDEERATRARVSRHTTQVGVEGLGLTGRLFFESVPLDRIVSSVDRPVARVLKDLGYREMSYLLENAVASISGDQRLIFGLLRTQRGPINFMELKEYALFDDYVRFASPVHVTFDMVSLWKLNHIFFVEHELQSRVGLLFEYVDPINWDLRAR